jgi:hypothetical protein
VSKFPLFFLLMLALGACKREADTPAAPAQPDAAPAQAPVAGATAVPELKDVIETN